VLVGSLDLGGLALLLLRRVERVGLG